METVQLIPLMGIKQINLPIKLMGSPIIPIKTKQIINLTVQKLKISQIMQKTIAAQIY